MPYPHHFQHQHHQSIHSHSHQHHMITHSNLDGSIVHSNGINPSSSLEVSPEGSDATLIQRGSGTMNSSPTAVPQNAYFTTSSSSLPTYMLTPAGITSSPSILTSTPTPPSNNITVSSSLVPSHAITRSPEDSQYLSTCPPEDVDMMPLDLSTRALPRTEANVHRTVTPDYHSGGCSLRSGSSAQGYSRSHRLSPYHLFTLGLARSPGSSTSLPLSRSPHSRSSSPFYQAHRQTPSPYYSYLTPNGSSYCNNSSENSSFQVLSATNRVLNGMSSTSGVFRPYEDPIPSDVTSPPTDEEATKPAQAPQEEEEEEEVPTYYDLDTVAQKQATNTEGEKCSKGDTCRVSSVNNHQFHGVNSLDARQYDESNTSPFNPSANIQSGSIMSFTSSSSSTSGSSSSPSSSTPSALLPSMSFMPQGVSEQAQRDLVHPSARDNGNAFVSYPSKDEAIQKSNNLQAIVSPTKVQITMSDNPIVTQEHQEYRQQHPDPDSSSSLSTLDSPSSSQSSKDQCSTSNTTIGSEWDPVLHQYPECDGSVTSTGSITSNKENLRDSQFRPQSFFRAPDKDFMEQTCRILAEKHRNECANRKSLLDFWISKIRIAAAQSRKSDICQNLPSKSKIKIRMVELMELQVEQSLRYDWR